MWSATRIPLLVCLLLTFAHLVAAANPPAKRARNVILITLDTVRADHLGCYGNKNIQTPTLDALGRDGVVFTPAANGTFLAGITRRRVIQLLRDAGKDVRERTITYGELQEADELFSVGNYGKVLPITRIEQRHLQPGPVYARARELYWDFAHST